MYVLKIAGMDQVSFEPVLVLMVSKIIWSTDMVLCAQKNRLIEMVLLSTHKICFG